MVEKVKRKNTPDAVTSSKHKNQTMRRTRSRNLKRKAIKQ